MIHCIHTSYRWLSTLLPLTLMEDIIEGKWLWVVLAKITMRKCWGLTCCRARLFWLVRCTGRVIRSNRWGLRRRIGIGCWCRSLELRTSCLGHSKTSLNRLLLPIGRLSSCEEPPLRFRNFHGCWDGPKRRRRLFPRIFQRLGWSRPSEWGRFSHIQYFTN